MKLVFSPSAFHHKAKSLANIRWRLLGWSIALLSLFVLLQTQIATSTPNSLILLALFILFSGLQALVISAFIFFFLQLPSKKQALTMDRNDKYSQYWLKLYQTVEWCEATLFFILLPLPSLVFMYAIFVVASA